MDALSAPPTKLKVGFVLAKSFTLSPFALFVDTLRLASDERDRSGRVFADWQVLASTRHPIKSSCGIQVFPTSDLIDPSMFDYIVVVGGLLDSHAPIDSSTIAFLKEAGKKITVIGLCTGVFILAEAGLMKNHQTCVSWLHHGEFRARFPDIDVRVDRIYNLDRSRGSCVGGSSAADMAAAIVGRRISEDAKRNALEVLQIERARSPLDVQPRRPLSIHASDPKVKAALILMEANIEHTLDIEELAAAVGVSRRQLERLFATNASSSPATIYMRVRLERAKLLLRRSTAPLIDIALEVGFENSSHFGRTFKKAFGQTPTKWRATDLKKYGSCAVSG